MFCVLGINANFQATIWIVEPLRLKAMLFVMPYTERLLLFKLHLINALISRATLSMNLVIGSQPFLGGYMPVSLTCVFGH